MFRSYDYIILYIFYSTTNKAAVNISFVARCGIEIISYYYVICSETILYYIRCPKSKCIRVRVLKKEI